MLENMARGMACEEGRQVICSGLGIPPRPPPSEEERPGISGGLNSAGSPAFISAT